MKAFEPFRIGKLELKNRLVVSAISLESISELTECMKEFHFTYAEAVSLAVARDKPVGAYHLMLGQNPVYLYTFQNEA